MDRTVENLLALSKSIGELKQDLAALRTRADTLAAEVGRLRGALEDIAAMRSWAGAWKPDCECGKRLPQIFDKADAALARAAQAGDAGRGGEGTDSPTGLTAQGV